ncbi:MAG: hypothetical protein GY713_14745 [Actinomycetia bacterium]|nr:hypothetical protein [Actinomycetes bacterium]
MTAPAQEVPQVGEEVLIRGLLRAIAIYRWLCLGWAGVGVFYSRDLLIRPELAWGLMVVALVVTVGISVRVESAPFSLLHPAVVGLELLVGLCLLLGDGLVYDPARSQSLPWAWPNAALITAGLAFGWRVGLGAALLMSLASFIGEGPRLLGRTAWGLSVLSKTGLFVLVGTVSGYAATRLRQAEREISAARAREEVSRRLHDGVLQTLAVIQRRSTDPELAALARDQEHDLRGFLAGDRPAVAEFEPRIRDLAARHESMFGGRVTIVVAEDLPRLNPDEVDALAGAVGEAMNNAGKHGQARSVTVYAEPGESGDAVFVSVKDDGSGFIADEVTEGIGMSRSIRGRMNDLGGRADIVSRPGRGTEVRLWL